MSFLKKHDIFLKLLAILIAIFLWSFVILDDNPPKTVRFPSLSVQMNGMEKLEERGLMLVNETEPKIDVSVTGMTQDVVELKQSDVNAAVDFSDIQEASTYYMQPSVSASKSSSVSFKPQRLQFKVENVVTRQVPVRVTTMNGLPDGRLVGSLEPENKNISIRGAESAVASVEYALLTVDLQNVSENTSQDCRAALYGAQDMLIDSPYITMEQQEIPVAIHLNHVVSVPLVVSTLPSAELARDMVETEITPKEIRVYGEKEAVSQLASLSLGTVDLKDVQQDGQSFKLSIKLPSGIELMEGEPEEAEVNVKVKDAVPRTINITNITLKDANTEEQKPTVSLAAATSLEVQIEGKANLVAAVTAADIHAEAEFNSAELGAGTHIVPVKLTVEKDGIQIADDTAEVSIIITQPQQAETNEPGEQP